MAWYDYHGLHNWHISLQQSAWELITPDWWRFDLRASHWRLYWHDGDGAALTIGGVQQPMSAHRLYFIPPDTSALGSTTCEVVQWYTHFHLLGLPIFTQRVLFDPLIEVPVSGILNDQAEALYTKARAGEIDLWWECRMKALLYAALGETLAALPPERIARSLHLHANLQPVLPAIEYIDQHLEEPITLELLGDLCTLTPVYFGRRFQQCTGMTPIRYLQEARIKAAMHDLAFTDHSIDEIAQRTGFGSRAYFTRIFTRHAGQSPAAYRKALRT